MSPAALLLVAIASAQAVPAEERPLESWTCTVSEQLDHNVSGMLQMMVDPDGTRRELSYYVNWADQPGYIAEQSMNWIWMPLDAISLWKPDEIALSLEGDRTDERGWVVFRSPRYGRLSRPARGLAKSLRPTFNTSWIKIEEAYLVAQLWAGWPWTVEHSDRKSAALGSQAVLLPGPEAAQAMFTRLRAKLDAAAADPAKGCRANLGKTQRELEEEQVHWGWPIGRSDLDSPRPVAAGDGGD